MNFQFIDGGNYRTVTSLEMGQNIICGLASADELCNYLLDLFLLSGGCFDSLALLFLCLEDGQRLFGLADLSLLGLGGSLFVFDVSVEFF